MSTSAASSILTPCVEALTSSTAETPFHENDPPVNPAELLKHSFRFRRALMLAAMLFEALDAGAPLRRTLMMRCLKSAVEEPRETWRVLVSAVKSHVRS